MFIHEPERLACESFTLSRLANYKPGAILMFAIIYVVDQFGFQFNSFINTAFQIWNLSMHC